MRVPEPFHRFWKALDRLFSSVSEQWWGAVITDGRYPRIWDANYARVDAPGVRLPDVEQALTPALRTVGSEIFHVVSFDPEATTALISELSSIGHRLAWDLVMEAPSTPPERPGTAVEEIGAGEERWDAVASSFELFGVDPDESVSQLRAIETDVLTPGGKRWFVVRGSDAEIASLAALVVLEGVGYIDNVATFPRARGRGYASALTSHIVHTTKEMGLETTFLIADPDDQPVVSLYERLGFREVGRLASTKGPLPADQATYL
jgi:GNAT superfamily N-acetyltransferase